MPHIYCSWRDIEGIVDSGIGKAFSSDVCRIPELRFCVGDRFLTSEGKQLSTLFNLVFSS